MTTKTNTDKVILHVGDMASMSREQLREMLTIAKERKEIMLVAPEITKQRLDNIQQKITEGIIDHMRLDSLRAVNMALLQNVAPRKLPISPLEYDKPKKRKCTPASDKKASRRKMARASRKKNRGR